MFFAKKKSTEDKNFFAPKTILPPPGIYVVRILSPSIILFDRLLDYSLLSGSSLWSTKSVILGVENPIPSLTLLTSKLSKNNLNSYFIDLEARFPQGD